MVCTGANRLVHWKMLMNMVMPPQRNMPYPPGACSGHESLIAKHKSRTNHVKEKIPMKDKRCRQTGCPFAAGWNMLRWSLNNKPIRWKILLINVAIFLLMAVFSCVLVYHTMFLPNERLLKK